MSKICKCTCHFYTKDKDFITCVKCQPSEEKELCGCEADEWGIEHTIEAHGEEKECKCLCHDPFNEGFFEHIKDCNHRSYIYPKPNSTALEKTIAQIVMEHGQSDPDCLNEDISKLLASQREDIVEEAQRFCDEAGFDPRASELLINELSRRV